MRIRFWTSIAIFTLIALVILPISFDFYKYQKTSVVFLEEPDDSSIPKQITLKGKIKRVILDNVARKPNAYYPNGRVDTQWDGYIYINERIYHVDGDKLYLMNVKGCGVWQIPSLPQLFSDCGIELFSEVMRRNSPDYQGKSE